MKTFSINNATSGETGKNSCIAIRIKRKNGAIRNLQAIIDSGNNLPYVALSLEEFHALRKAGIIKSDVTRTDIKAASADANQIDVIGVAEGNWTIYLGKKHACNVQTFIIIKNLMNQMNIGIRLLQELGAVLDFKHDRLQVGASSIPLLKQKERCYAANAPTLSVVELGKVVEQDPTGTAKHKHHQQVRVYNKDTVTIPPYSMAILNLATHSKDEWMAQ